MTRSLAAALGWVLFWVGVTFGLAAAWTADILLYEKLAWTAGIVLFAALIHAFVADA